MKYRFLPALLLCAVTSCSFLDVIPDKSGNATINTMEQLYDLMGNSGFYNDLNYLWSENLLFSDDVELSPYLYSKTGKTNAYLANIADHNFLTYDPSMLETTWSEVYRNMFTFNTVLELLDKVEPTTVQMYHQVKGEALFNRAYFHFFGLVNYCGYDLNSPGIGYRDNTKSAPAGIPKRQTAAYTVSRIRQDLSDAEEALRTAGRTEFNLDKNFRVTLPSLYAFQARFELYLGNYEKALEASLKALEGHSSLHDIIRDPMYAKSVVKTVAVVDADGVPTGETVQVKDFKTDLNSQFGGDSIFLEYEELYLPHFSIDKFGSAIHPMSESLYELFDKEHDGRWLCFYDNNYIVGLGSFSSGGFDPVEQKNLSEWERHAYLRFNIYGNRVFVTAPTVAEMYLIAAECYSRNGDESKARDMMVTLRNTRFTDYESAAQIGGSLSDVLDERRREFGGVLRFYDLKRMNFGENAAIGYTKEMLMDPNDFGSEVINRVFSPDDAELYTFPVPESERLLLGW